MKKSLFLYVIIFLEGYVVLSAELLAIRQVTPFAGGGTGTTSIIISAVLLPLALGYYFGGKFKGRSFFNNTKTITIRAKLLQNIFISTFFLAIGSSYFVIEYFFQIAYATLKMDRVSTTFLYSFIFLVIPVFLLAQTIPLVSHYFKKVELPLITGKMLFFSTIGSLMGGVFSTLVLMATIGVNLTVTITIICLCVLYFMLSKKAITKKSMIILCLTGISLYINSNSLMRKANIVESNAYNTVLIYENDGKRVMSLDNGTSAGIDSNGNNVFQYMEHIEKNFINPIRTEESIKSILAIGAGGFTLGLKDHKNDYTFVDIDGSLKDVSEQYFLKRKLGSNKKFHALPARAYLSTTKQKFDFIYIDTYLGRNIPEHLVTKEFFESVKAKLNDNGIVTMNIIASPTFNNEFSVNIDNTLKAVFPNINREIIGNYNAWANHTQNSRNITYSYFHKNYDKNPEIYTDNKNRSYYDKTKIIE